MSCGASVLRDTFAQVSISFQWPSGSLSDDRVLVADCEMNIHKGCVRIIEESCIGAIHRKERGNDRISKIVDRFRPEREIKRKLTPQGMRGTRISNLVHFSPVGRFNPATAV